MQNQDWLHSRLWRFQGWNIHSGSSYKLDRMIKQEVTLPIDQSTFWTDSTCVLCCIENKGKRFQTFAANHISAILDQSTITQWRHVDTIQNPADEASRGMTVKAVWPQRPTDMGKISPNDPEVKKTAQAFASETSKQIKDYISKTFERFSSWTCLKRVVAWILRYKGMLRR